MFQRSADTPIGLPANMAQYAALTYALAHILNLEPYEYVHSISDAHIYIDQLTAVQTILKREARIFPTLKMNLKKNQIFDFYYQDFEIEDYHPHPGIKMPVAV